MVNTENSPTLGTRKSNTRLHDFPAYPAPLHALADRIANDTLDRELHGTTVRLPRPTTYPGLIARAIPGRTPTITPTQAKAVAMRYARESLYIIDGLGPLENRIGARARKAADPLL